MSEVPTAQKRAAIAVPRRDGTASYPAEFDRLAEYVQSIKFGSVTLQIENGRIIQIDKNEKFRFDKR